MSWINSGRSLPVSHEGNWVYRLGGLQEGMLFHELYNEQGAFTEQLSCDLMTLQTDKFIRSWKFDQAT
ncbi:hypothetical protein CS542_09085 [Pedobacter sp. IW39]|nr:hypothetical protein CS542_09085 [Pedobacter sp. IW39]